MNTGNEDFENLRKLLKLKRYEQPPPGYFNRFSTLVVNRIEKEGEPVGPWVEVPWLRKLFRTFESSPLVAGLFGSALCALVIFGIAAANSPDKAPSTAVLSSVDSSTMTAPSSDSLIASDSHAGSLGKSTDPIFGAGTLASPFSSGSARLEQVSFTAAAPQ